MEEQQVYIYPGKPNESFQKKGDHFKGTRIDVFQLPTHSSFFGFGHFSSWYVLSVKKMKKQFIGMTSIPVSFT